MQPDPGLEAYWAAIDEATNARDAVFIDAISVYEAAIKQARANYLAYQDSRDQLRQSAREDAGQKGGQ